MCSYLSRCLQLRYTLRTTGGQFEFLCLLRPHNMIIIVVICQFEIQGQFYSRRLHRVQVIVVVVCLVS